MLQSGPPDTAAYYRIAYTWVIVAYGAYAIALWWRAKRVRAQLRAAGNGEARATRGI
ncbi:MAG TPA: hypothetical protein VH080_00550 [Gemmatimonadaceae bacterium]|jgi:hypothetical protein|nr:hypothetical protein [Gemmatimonadaceae bacterium]